MMGRAGDLSHLSARLAALEGAQDIRRLVARYMELCDGLGAATPMREIGELFASDAVWEGAGARYRRDFGTHKGRASILAFLETYRAPAPHFASNVHFLTSESLLVSGARAEGAWVMLQTPTFATGESFLLAARLLLKFKREDDAWRISRFRTVNLFTRRIDGAWAGETPIPTPRKSIAKGRRK